MNAPCFHWRPDSDRGSPPCTLNRPVCADLFDLETRPSSARPLLLSLLLSFLRRRRDFSLALLRLGLFSVPDLIGQLTGCDPGPLRFAVVALDALVLAPHLLL